MASNPMFNTKQVSNNATAPSNPLNNPDKRYFRGRNHFDYSRRFYGTFRYADIMPFECIHGVEGDILNISSHHNIRSHALSSVVQSPVFMKRTYTFVDLKCILPLNWDKIYKVPTQGNDDVPIDTYTFYNNFFYDFGIFIRSIANQIISRLATTGGMPFTDSLLTIGIRSLRLFELVLSSGSLLNYLGLHTEGIYRYANLGFYVNTGTSFSISERFENLDEFISFLWNWLYTKCSNLSFSNPDTNITTKIGDMSLSQFRGWLDDLSSNYDITVKLPSGFSNTSADGKALSEIFTTLNAFAAEVNNQDENSIPVNFDSILAYQISCATFFSRDSIDSIYSAELYRELMKYYYGISSKSVGVTVTPHVPTFTYNGRAVDYDILSSHIIKKILSTDYNGYIASNATWSKSNGLYGALAYLYSIFSINKSLRYGDYFTGSKLAPLAVGDVTAEVNSGSVNALDVTRSILKARFLNAVNRARNSMKSFIEDVMDGQEPPRDDEPRWLLTVTSRVKGFEVENTSSQQGKIVTLLNSSDTNHIYEVEVGRPAIILGLLTFEVPRVYSQTIDRFFFHSNRYDMFNKFMQYTGDQQILRSERNSAERGNLDNGSSFGYTPRHMEYKQRYPIAVGGYVNELNTYLFVTDNLASENTDSRDYPAVNIDSYYIRSKNHEFDRFFPSLTGNTLANYYHFYIAFDNICHAYRKMEKNPTIL